MQLEDHGLVYDARERPTDERIAAFVSLVKLESGTFICGFQLGERKHAVNGTVRLCRSRDGGQTWAELPARFSGLFQGVPGSLSSGEIVEVEPGKLMLLTTWFDRSDPERPLFDPVTEGILHSRQLKCYSTDEGETWSNWEEVPVAGLAGCASTGPVLQWRDGTIAYAFESYKEYDDPSPAAHGAWLTLSHDNGKSFEAQKLVAQHPQQKVYYWDQRLCVGPRDGDYIALFWTHDLAEKRDLTVHFTQGNVRHETFDRDPIIDTHIPGQIAAPLLLKDGRILAFVVDRGRPGTMTLWQSRDCGRTWPRDDALVVYTHDERALLTQGKQNIDFKQYWEDMGKWSFGHPAIRPLPNGRVLVAHYAGIPDAMSVHWARIDANG